MSNTIPIDLNREKMVLLLKRLTQGMLELDDARELKGLLKKEKENAKRINDNIYEKQLDDLIIIIDSFIAGEIDLRTNPVSTTKTHRYNIQ